MALPGYIDLAVATVHFSFQFLQTLPFETAQHIAVALSNTVEQDFDTLNPWFDWVMSFDARITVLIGMQGADGGGSAVATAGDPKGVKQIWLGVSDQSSVDAVVNVCTNELSEIFMIVQNKGWTNDGSAKIGSPGEALSRVIADTLRPYAGMHDDGIPMWLFQVDPAKHVLRYNWVDTADSTDTNGYSWGCGLLFLYYLRSQLGFSMHGIVNTGSNTLGDVYRRLTQAWDAFTDFSALIEQKYPQNGPPYVENDNPFPLQTPHVLSTLKYLQWDAHGRTTLLQLVGEKNVGNVRALLNSDRPISLVR